MNEITLLGCTEERYCDRSVDFKAPAAPDAPLTVTMRIGDKPTEFSVQVDVSQFVEKMHTFLQTMFKERNDLVRKLYLRDLRARCP